MVEIVLEINKILQNEKHKIIAIDLLIILLLWKAISERKEVNVFKKKYYYTDRI